MTPLRRGRGTAAADPPLPAGSCHGRGASHGPRWRGALLSQLERHGVGVVSSLALRSPSHRAEVEEDAHLEAGPGTACAPANHFASFAPLAQPRPRPQAPSGPRSVPPWGRPRTDGLVAARLQRPVVRRGGRPSVACVPPEIGVFHVKQRESLRSSRRITRLAAPWGRHTQAAQAQRPMRPPRAPS